MSRASEFNHLVLIVGDGYLAGIYMGIAHTSPLPGDGMRLTLPAAKQMAGMLKLRNRLNAMPEPYRVQAND